MAPPSPSPASRRWVDCGDWGDSDEEGLAFVDFGNNVSDFDEEALAPNTYAMLVFYNLHVDALECKARRGSHSVKGMLNLSDRDWDIDFGNAKVKDIAVGGVSFDYRRRNSDKAAAVISTTFVLIERKALQCENQIYYSKAKSD